MAFNINPRLNSIIISLAENPDELVVLVFDFSNNFSFKFFNAYLKDIEVFNLISSGLSLPWSNFNFNSSYLLSPFIKHKLFK